MGFEPTTPTLARSSMAYTRQGVSKVPSKRQLKSGKWNVQVRVKGHPSVSNTFASELEADQWAQRIAGHLKGASVPCPTWAEMGLLYCNTVLNGKPSRHLKVGRVTLIGRHLKMDKPYDQITVADINDFKLSRLDKVSTSTVRDDLVFIRRVYRWLDREARSRGCGPVANPAEFVTIPKARPPRSRLIHVDELNALIGAITPVMRPIVELAFETAMRRSEIVKLRSRDIRLSERILDVIDGKEGDRSVPLSKRACQILADAIENTGCNEARLFPFAAHSVTQAFRRARQKVGLDDDVRFHQLRHTRSTIVARKGFNQAQIMAVTGHKDVRSVQRYTHLNAKDVVDLL
ncbi:tyrosine-type recombinase/integrase [Roseibium album]|uniref:tyrosine-type recombinase/integrase n=1 Tax=Roseibium album TaxID=311410 RepID=UPI0032975153